VFGLAFEAPRDGAPLTGHAQRMAEGRHE
jgi:hypothetical protein